MTTSDGLHLHMTRVLPAPREDVYRAMTDQEEFMKWWGPRGSPPRAWISNRAWAPTIESRCSLPMEICFTWRGSSKRSTPERLAFTFRWEPPDPDDRETLVATLTLEDRGDETGAVHPRASSRPRNGERYTREAGTTASSGWRTCSADQGAQVSELRRSNARIDSGWSSGASKKRRLTHS